jgi:hypothetical protein
MIPSARRAILLMIFGLSLAAFNSSGEPIQRLSPALSPVVNVLANGLAWQIRPTLLSGENGWEAGALIGLLENASGNPADFVTGNQATFGFSSYGKLSIEVVSGTPGVFPYAPIGPAEYDPRKREVVFPAMAAAGVRISRTIRVSEDGSACAWLNQFVNETSQPLTIWATLTSDLDPLSPAEWVLTSNGDAVPDLKDEWLVSQSRDGGTAVGHVLGHAGTQAFLSQVRMTPGRNGKTAAGTVSFTYQIQLDPGQTGSISHLALLGKSVHETADRAAGLGEDKTTRSLFSPREARQTLNFDARRLTCCDRCIMSAPWFLEPEPRAVLDGPFLIRVRADSFDYMPPDSLTLFAQFPTVDATGSVIVWISRQVDYYDYKLSDIFWTQHYWDYAVDHSATLDTRSFAGGCSADRRIEAVLRESYCWPYQSSAVLSLIDGNPCQTHVDIISPAGGTTLDRPVNLSIQPYCPSSANLECSVDGSVLFTQTVQKQAGRLAPPRVYYLLGPATIKAGSRTLTAKISDAAGCSETKSVTLFIPNQPPTLDLTAPREGGTVFGPVPIQFRATDDRRLDRIEVFVDGVLAARNDLSGTSVDSSLDWDSCGVANGHHSVRVVVTDWDDAAAERTVQVEVRNVIIDLATTRREAQQKSLVDLRFAYQNPGLAAIGSFAVWRKAEGREFDRISTIPLASAPGGSGTWVDMPGKSGSFTYKIEALDAGGRIIGRSRETGI